MRTHTKQITLVDGFMSRLRQASKRSALLAALFCALSLSACATANPPKDDVVNDINDPFEPFNRKMFAAGQGVDKVALKPAAQVYTKLPDRAEASVYNFVTNLREPVTIVNDVLQWQWRRAGVATGRFFINTIVGVGGIFDPATAAGLPHHKEDFGQTLAVWGVPEGNYAYLPIWGPAPTRDGMAYFVDLFFDPLVWMGGASLETLFWTNTVLGGLDLRARNLDTLDELEASSVDYYASMRNLYRQTRDREIRNGQDDFSDLPDFEDFDEDF